MDGLETDTAFVKDLCQWAGLAPSALARRAGLAATTMLRPFNGQATSRISQPTLGKLRRHFPEFPGWSKEYPDQLGGFSGHSPPNENTDDLVYVRSLNIELAMGNPISSQDYPDTELVPFNLGFIRTISNADTDSLIIMKGHGDSMEPTLMRGDLLMIDTALRNAFVSDAIWGFHYAGGAMIKRLRRIMHDGNECFLIISDNTHVPNQVAQCEDIHIIGKLVWIGRQI